MTTPLIRKVISLQDTICNLECKIARQSYKGTKITVESAKEEITEIIMDLFKMEDITKGTPKAGTDFREQRMIRSVLESGPIFTSLSKNLN